MEKMETVLLGVLVLSEWLILSTGLPRQYHFVDQKLTWTEAQTYCRLTYSDLATVENAEEMSELLSRVSAAGYDSDVWMGVHGDISWRWSDGFTGGGAGYRKWANPSSESQFSKDQICVDTGNDGNWFTYICKEQETFICYRGTPLDPDFVLVKKRMSWSGAQRFCRENYADLATVRNDGENQKVQELVPSGEFSWIGLFREPDFYWSDGSNSSFSNWESVSNPSGSKMAACGVTSLKREGRWGLLSCTTQSPFICYSPPPAPVRQQVVKLRLKMADSVDANHPAVKAGLLQKLQAMLLKNGVSGVTLTWREQPDGKVLHRGGRERTEP